MPVQSNRRFGFAWLAFAVAISIHVLDEAKHDFLSFYNPNAGAIRARLPFLPLPTFTFESWLTALVVGITLFVCLSPFAFRGVRWARFVAIAVAILAGILNAGGHMLTSVYYHRWMPGAFSSPPLLIAALFLLAAALSRKAEPTGVAAVH